MVECISDLSKMSWKDLKEMLSNDPDYEANREVARRIVENYQAVVDYFLGSMSKGIVDSLNKMLGRNSFSEYYVFISHPINEDTKKPSWHKIDLYDARDCNLISYSSRISHRHFSKIAKKKKMKANSEEELLDYRDYESLLMCDQPEEDGENITHIRMKRAFGKLKERDQKVLQYLVIDKKAGLDAYPLLEEYIHTQPKNGMTSEEIKKAWTSKQKQDAVSLMKGRALQYLLVKYNEEKLNNKKNENR